MSDTNPPPISIPKKRAREDVGSLIQEKGRIDNEVKEKKKKLKAHGSFNAKFWSTAHEVESLILERTHVERKISLADFGGHPARWLAADWATSQCPCTAKAEPWRGFHGPLHHKPYGTQYQEWLRSKKQVHSEQLS